MLTENIQEFIWTEEQQKSWKELKKRLTTAPNQSYPDVGLYLTQMLVILK